ncbi:hypothetical protein QTO30_15980 [Yoonia sp. GPGPB17]
MSSIAKAFVGARIHDGVDFVDDDALVMHADGSRGTAARRNL